MLCSPSVNAVHDRVSMHGVRLQPAGSAGSFTEPSLHTLELPEMPGMTEYENIMTTKLNAFKSIGLYSFRIR